MDRTIGPSNHWTIFLDYFFLDYFWTIQFGPSTGPIFGPFFRPFYRRGGRPLGCSLSVLRKGWEASCCSYKLLERFFDRLFFTSNCLRWTAAFLYIFGMRMRNWHLNTGNNCYCYKNIVGTIVRSDLLSFLIHSFPLVECHVTHFTS